MQKIALMPALLAAMSYHPTVLAEPIRLEEMESRIRSLEDRLLDHEKEPRETSTTWSDRITFNGLIEVEAEMRDARHGDSESSLTLATLELDLSARISPTVHADIALLYEDDGDNPLDVDVAAVTYEPTETWHLTAGRVYLPFGRYETRMISDPLTLELGETRETALLAGYARAGFNGVLYLFDGDARGQSAQRIVNFGIDLGYALQGEGYGLNVQLGYIDDLGDSDGLIEYAGEIHQRVGGLAFGAILELGPFTLIGESVGARDAFESGETPRAYNVEAAYAFTLAGRKASLALGRQGTRDAAATELPHKRSIATLSLSLLEETAFGLEVSSSEGCQGERSRALLVQLSSEF